MLGSDTGDARGVALSVGQSYQAVRNVLTSSQVAACVQRGAETLRAALPSQLLLGKEPESEANSGFLQTSGA
jgi:hypothetical protein